MYCTRCGKEIPEGMATCPSCDEVYARSVIGTQAVSDGLLRGYNSLGGAKAAFWVTLGLFILNIIMSFMDMVEFNAILFSGKGSLYEIIEYFIELESGFGSNDGFYEFILILLKAGLVLTVICVVSMILPLILNKKYSRACLVLNYPTTILILFVYVLMLSSFMESNDEIGLLKISPNLFLYILETFIAFISTIVFAVKLKEQKKYNNK